MFLTPTLLRRTAQVVLAAFLSLTLQPLQAAMQAPQTRATQETGEARYARLLAEMEGLAVELAPQAFHSLAIKTDGKQVRALGPNLKITIEDKLAHARGERRRPHQAHAGQVGRTEGAGE